MFHICTVGKDERAALFSVVQRYWAEIMPHAPVVRDPAVRPRYFADQFRFDEAGSYQWWAVLDEAWIGFANVELSADWTGHEWAYVEDFYIEPAWRRQGHGRAFALAVIDWLHGRGVYRIDLHVRSDNPAALAFWRAVGFDLASYRMRKYMEF